MPTTADYLNDLVAQKNALVDNLNAKGVSASQSETLNSLVPKVLDISGEGGGGSDTYYDDFWDDYQKYSKPGDRYNYNSAFFGSGWTDKSYKPKYSFDNMKYFQNCFYEMAITDTLQPITFTNTNQYNNIFYKCKKLETIQTLTVHKDMTFVNWFYDCPKLTKITFTGEIGNNIDFSACPLLSKESIMNIISVLVNYTDTGTTKHYRSVQQILQNSLTRK